MKKTIYSIIAAAAACGFAGAQTTAYTTPVGYVSLGDTTVGQPAVKANTDSMIAIPLSRPSEFRGTVSSIDATTITVSGTPSWTVNQFAVVGLPYWVVIESGTQNGALALITANTSDTLTVSYVLGSSTGVVAGGLTPDKVSISPAWTIGSFLPLTTIPNGTQLIAYDGLANGINLAPSQIYVKGTTQWTQTAGGSGNANNAVLYPGESFILRTGPNAVTSLVVAGEVPIANHRTTINKRLVGVAQDTRVSYFSPVGSAMSVSSIPASTGDTLIIFNNAAAGRNKGASVILTRGSSAWIGTFGVSGNQDAFQIGSGVGYIYRRGAAQPVGDLNWSDTQTYIPSL